MATPDPQIKRNDDGSITIWIDDISGTVSSDHLVEPKIHQIRAAWTRLRSSAAQ